MKFKNDDTAVSSDNSSQSVKEKRKYKKRGGRPVNAKDYIRLSRDQLQLLDEITKIGQFGTLR